MSRKRAVLAAIVVLLGGGAIVFAFERQRARERAGPQPEGVDYRMAPLAAAYDAPDGATPCETAYNAFRAMDDVAKQRGVGGVPWGTLPDRATFLARCDRLTPQEQECAQPRYQARHHKECDPIANRWENKNPLFQDTP
jgi:hypothetical protein